MNTRLLLFCLFLLAASMSAAAQSHVRLAHEARFILSGEVVSVKAGPTAHPHGGLGAGSQITYQAAVFRVDEVFKGEYPAKFIRILTEDWNYPYSEKGYESRHRLEKGDKRIIIPFSHDGTGYCSYFCPKEFDAFACYTTQPDSVFRANDEELEAFRVLGKNERLAKVTGTDVTVGGHRSIHRSRGSI